MGGLLEKEKKKKKKKKKKKEKKGISTVVLIRAPDLKIGETKGWESERVHWEAAAQIRSNHGTWRDLDFNPRSHLETAAAASQPSRRPPLLSPGVRFFRFE